MQAGGGGWLVLGRCGQEAVRQLRGREELRENLKAGWGGLTCKREGGNERKFEGGLGLTCKWGMGVGVLAGPWAGSAQDEEKEEETVRAPRPKATFLCNPGQGGRLGFRG
jgi:hypothetical protein